MKGAGMLVVSLRVFWEKRHYIQPLRSRLGMHAMTINDELKIYGDAFKNYLWVKVFDYNVFAIIKSHCIFYLSLYFLKWSHLGVKKNLGHAQVGLLYGFNFKFRTSIPAPFIW